MDKTPLKYSAHIFHSLFFFRALIKTVTPPSVKRRLSPGDLAMINLWNQESSAPNRTVIEPFRDNIILDRFNAPRSKGLHRFK